MDTQNPGRGDLGSYLFLARRAAAVSGGQSGRTRLGIPRYVAVLRGAADAQRPDGIGVSIAIAIVVIPAAVARSPDKDGAFAATTLQPTRREEKNTKQNKKKKKPIKVNSNC